MLGFVGAVMRIMRRRLGWALVLGSLLGLAGAAAGANMWAQGHYDAAVRALREDHLDDARAHVRECLRVWWRSPSAHLLAARIERCRGNYPEAEDHLQEYKRLKKVDADYQLEWVMLRAQFGGDLEEVEPGLWNCVKQNDSDAPLILEALARAYMRHMNFRRAAVTLSEWLRRQPDLVRALDWRGWVMERMANRAGAVEDYKHALAVDPERTLVRLRLVEILLDDGATVDVAPHVEYLERTHPERIEVQLAAARYRYLKSDFDGARRLLDQVLASHPDHTVALFLRGKLELEAGQPVEAETWLRRALQTDPFLLDGHNALHTCLRQQGNRESEAAAEYKRYEALRADAERLSQLLGGDQLEKTPSDASIPSEIGIIFLRTGQEQTGLYWLEMVALKRDPSHVPTHVALARYYESKNQSEKAAEHRLAANMRN